MKIAVLGAGARGGLYSSYLSKKNDVIVVDVNASLVEKVNTTGLEVVEPDGSSTLYHPRAITGAKASDGHVDVVIVFVKAMYTQSALEANRSLIGKNTYLMTLQNGSGHEYTLKEYVDDEHVIIGTTQHNASIAALGVTRHGGSGLTHLGCIKGDVKRLQPIADAFTACGITCDVSDGVQKLIWNKMFTNVSASVLTGILQVPLGYIVTDVDAWDLCTHLIQETVDVAKALGMGFDYEEKCAEVKGVCERSPQGLTSIYADLKNHRKSEVDTISGSVVRAGLKAGIPTPCHSFVVRLVHAMEGRPRATS